MACRIHLGLIALLASAACAAGVAPASAQAPAASPVTAASVFGEARAAASELPPLLATRELEYIAGDELLAEPKLALPDFRQLYQAVQLWPTQTDTAPERAGTDLRSDVEDDAIEVFARQGRFDQALSWAANYSSGSPGDGGTPVSWVYDVIIIDMLRRGDFGQVDEALRQCVSGGNCFPFHGAATALDAAKLPEPERFAIATEGVQAAAGATAFIPMRDSATFLAAVHSAFPGMDSEVGDAIASLLHNLKVNAGQHRDLQPGDSRVGSELLAILSDIDPEYAEELRAQYPAASTARQPPRIVLYASPTGKIVGAGGPDAAIALSQLAARDPAGAISGALGFHDKGMRFGALANVALALAASRPELARQTAADAYALLDKDMAMAATGATGKLAQAYAKLGDPARSAEVAGLALQAADTHAQQAESQYDLSTLAGQAAAERGPSLPSALLTFTYRLVATVQPGLALAAARACECPVMKALVLAKIAVGMTPAGTKPEPYN
ncbi:MAG: hypothetical protein ACRD04_06395 [Terriglobales bacterium]